MKKKYYYIINCIVLVILLIILLIILISIFNKNTKHKALVNKKKYIVKLNSGIKSNKKNYESILVEIEKLEAQKSEKEISLNAKKEEKTNLDNELNNINNDINYYTNMINVLNEKISKYQ